MSDSKIILELKGNRSEEQYYSNWEINRISNSINNMYYKNELLMEMNNLIKKEREDGFLICMNNSLAFSNAYNRYIDNTLELENPKDICQLYYLGLPVPFEKNKLFYLLQISFNIYRNTFSFFNSKTHEISVKPPKNRDAIPAIYQKVQEWLNSKPNNPSEDLIEIISSEINMSNEIEQKDSNYKKKLEDLKKRNIKNLSDIFDSLNKIIMSSSLPSNFPGLKVDFSSTFNSLERPIVGWFDRKNNTVQILGTPMFVRRSFSKKNPQFFETRQISQNSPLLFVVGVSIYLGGAIIRTIQKKIENSRINREKLEKEKRAMQKQEDNESELQELEAKIDLLVEENKLLEKQKENIIRKLQYQGKSQKVVSDVDLPKVSGNIDNSLSKIENSVNNGIENFVLDEMHIDDIKEH